MIIKENLPKILGRLHLDIIQNESIVYSWESNNTIVNSGLELLCSLLANIDTTNKKISKFGVGNSDVNTDKDLHYALQGSQQFIGLLTDTSLPSFNQVRFDFEMSYDDGYGIEFKEFGLYSQDEVLFNRVLYTGSPIIKTNYFAIKGYFLLNLGVI